MGLDYHSTVLVLLLRTYSFWLMTSTAWSLDLQCSKCIHMESSGIYALLVKLPTNPLCTKANYGNLENATIVSCPEKPSGHDEKRFMCGDMRGNLTANIQTKFLGRDIDANVQGSLFYRDCILVDTNVVEGCQQNIIGPMEKAALQELGLTNANVKITNFQGSTCLSAPLDDSRELSTDYQTVNEATPVNHDPTSGSNTVNLQSRHVVTLFYVYFVISRYM